MKFLATLSLVALIAMPASVLAKRPQLTFTPWTEEHCHQAARTEGKTLKPGECETLKPFRSFQIVASKREEKLQDYCVLQVYPTEKCHGEHSTFENIKTASNECSVASFPFDSGVNSGRSVQVVCNKPAPAKPVQPTTTAWIPVLPSPVSSIPEAEVIKATVPLSPSAIVTTAIFLKPAITSVLTTQTLTISSGMAVNSTSTEQTSTTWVSPTSASSTSTVWVSPPSTTITFTTAFGRKLPHPTKRAEEEAL
ncbi:hypothetical protein BDV97DRAFT_362028 [Delphinella strobiligena]|nr:hypothetical protein BDV97DRAFT_362028 [Delphinella strobiligena]